MQAVDWELVVRKHGPAVWYSAYRLLGNEADAADCFQETFVCALEVSRRQRVRHFPALLVGIATSRAINRLRQRKRQPRCRTDPGGLANAPAADPGPREAAQQHELAGKLRDALGRLGQQEAEVFCLRCLNNMSYRKIAGQLGIKTSTAGVLLHRARNKLQGILEPVFGEEK